MAAETIKILAQTDPAAATLTDSYTVPSGANAVVSSVVVCNRSATATSFRISIAQAGAVDTNKQYLYFDLEIGGNDTFIATIGITLDETDVIRVRATLATLSFNVFGTEID